MRNESFEKYVSNLKSQINSIWKPIRNKIPKQQPQYANIQHLRDIGQNSTRKETEIFAEYLFEFFSSHNNNQCQEAEQDLTTHIQSQECLNKFTLKEIKDEIKVLNQKGHQVSTLLLPKC
jgi:hypothetical protein